MSAVHIAFTRESGTKSPLLVADAAGVSESITSSGSNQVSTNSSPFQGSGFSTPAGVVSITSLGGDVLVAIGDSPNAVTGDLKFPIADGQTRDFYCQFGDKVAVVDA